MAQWLVAGLGNPGQEYAQTRHNAGFRVVDSLADEMRCRYWKNECGALTAKGAYRDNDIVLAKPQKAAVLCHSPQAAKAQRAVCTAGCIACGKCQKVCPTAAIAVQNNLAVVNDALCDGCGACAAACPAKCITLF